MLYRARRQHPSSGSNYGGEHGENGYAIGFNPRGLLIDGNTVVVKVNYDTALHQEIAEETARLTLQYYQDGLLGPRLNDPVQWGKEFFAAWDQAIYRLSPIAKDDGFSHEREYRLIHELQSYDMPFRPLSGKKPTCSAVT